jgi:uncharacterized protein
MSNEKKKQGFALLSPERISEIGRKGGLAATKLGVAHHFTKEEASIAGRLGGLMSAAKKRTKQA